MENSEIFNDTFFAMGTRCDVVLPGFEPELGEQVFQVIKSEVFQIENQLSRFIPNSPVSKINKAPKNNWINVSEDLWEILTICYDFYQLSNGAFDVTAAPLISLWKKSNRPSEYEIEEAGKRSGFDKVELDFENHAIRFLEDKMEFDFGALGKGIALDTIKPIIQKQGIKSGIVSFGESSVLALGSHPKGNHWPLGIRNQILPNEYIHVFDARNESVTTSGTILTTDDGGILKRGHIISPATGQVVDNSSTISVKSESATMGEFISTAWLILPENDKIILSENLKNIEILEVTYLEDKDIKTKLTILND
ncbi:MAG: FAD:protein FMN transferase, partial [Draconibacterium sp.]|nr:FAD:protein FMN transferase [Draconibacterium sp.]